MELYDVSQMYAEGRDEEQSCACPSFHQWPVEVHSPQLGLDQSRR
jgi:hypothetical protein